MYDLHFHTTHSDGVNSSQEMVDAAISKWVRLIACTEHDIVNREVPRLVSEFHSRVENLYFQQAPYIDAVEWVEVSVGHQDGEYNKSMHIATYSRYFGSEYDDFLTRIRDGRVEKIKLQCDTLDSHGFRILFSGKIVPFSLANLLARFPLVQPDNLNNAHINEVIIENPENVILLISLTWGEVNEKNFLRQWLKREGKHSKMLSLPHDLPAYEPTFESLMSQLDRENTVISLVHPHLTFATQAEFQERIGRLVELGLSAIEINNQAPPEWVELILRNRKEYDLLLTFGSDSHGAGVVDRIHGELGTINPHIANRTSGLEYWKERFLYVTYGDAYRHMMNGDYS